ncbi:uncharacterized protein EV154DRAFT_540830 [Mucor mucedo]|uniref:uncharacterized protein n=1 Tax=Mucor mucedo TaxID=29922 RepID=UPI00221E9EFF|nr:uncharacterized protein EV154DRAFT_540830 [Mucor mucedo]KAI7869594.1 hypothetical protein EV154DRAFT_540830 [Mucor mucedo]
MFAIPPPPPLGVPHPPFDRDISPPRKRTRTSPEQLAILEKSFSTNPSPNNRVREQLAHQLCMPERSIQIWFQNRRAKVKNQAKRNVQMKDSALYIQQQYAASAAAAACQSAAFQQQRDTIDPNLYYYYYYYYFHQQRQLDPKPTASYSTPTSSGWSSSTPDLTLSASTSSSSIGSDNLPRRPLSLRSSSSSSSSMSSSHHERTRAHSVGPYPYYRKSTPQERHSSLGPPPLPSLYGGIPDSRLYNSTIIEEPYHITPSVVVVGGIMKQRYNLSAQTLQIGSWKRVSDLNCQIDLQGRTLQWTIGDEQQQFRIDINLNLVQFIKKSQHRLEFFLSSPLELKFYMTTQEVWVQCHDFTQDKQASIENVHVLESMDDLLHIEFMEILMQAPELQSLIIEEEENTMNNNLLLLQSLHLPQQ